jgi:hypothetical protein
MGMKMKVGEVETKWTDEGLSLLNNLKAYVLRTGEQPPRMELQRLVKHIRLQPQRNQKVTFRLSSEVVERVKWKAAEEGVPYTDLIRRAMENAFPEGER